MLPRHIQYLGNEAIAGLTHGVKVTNLRSAGMEFYHCSGEFTHVYAKGFVCLSVDGTTVAAQESFNYARGDFMINNKIDYDDVEVPNALKIDGLCVSLAAPWSFNFFHWMEELLKACWIESHGVHPNYIIPNNSPIFSESLELLGIPKSRIVSVNGSNLCFHECLLTPQINFHPRVNFRPLLENFQNHIYSLPSSSSSTAPCFMLRKQGGLTFSNRELMNKEEVTDFCNRLGIEYFDPSELSFASQVDAFRNRRILSGIHGAGFSHQIWMKQKSSIIEVFSPKFIHFSSLNLANALNNHYFMCTQDSRDAVKTGSGPEQIYANITLLENIFETAAQLIE
jgi:capsular polysaccharide biosynthesis protein